MALALVWQGALIEAFVDHGASADCDDDHGGVCHCPDGCHGCVAGAHARAPALPTSDEGLGPSLGLACLLQRPRAAILPPSPPDRLPLKVPKTLA